LRGGGNVRCCTHCSMAGEHHQHEQLRQHEEALSTIVPLGRSRAQGTRFLVD
jgi:hypothetical protein